MAQPYLDELENLSEEWHGADAGVGLLECRHFFSGAAVYRDGAIVASLTPVGLAFKVPAEVHDELQASGVASPLRYFPTGPVKKNYVLFPDPAAVNARDAARLLRGRSLEGKG